MFIVRRDSCACQHKIAGRKGAINRLEGRSVLQEPSLSFDTLGEWNINDSDLPLHIKHGPSDIRHHCDGDYGPIKVDIGIRGREPETTSTNTRSVPMYSIVPSALHSSACNLTTFETKGEYMRVQTLKDWRLQRFERREEDDGSQVCVWRSGWGGVEGERDRGSHHTASRKKGLKRESGLLSSTAICEKGDRLGCCVLWDD
ncbi:hypothetical protein BDY19DRAFT_910554 [Irpex rosettiformis]|uniref:Uncharacterized protein n=1 Tax=Irpex rosettiformis TaxID=378272 RepID=A0ACB8TN83_9APHY|nr:hypothetical protein BDY19DRAFT_910554 [Irpex rosettiformis]